MREVKTLALPEMPNEITMRAFTEDKQSMPIFDTVDELRKDLVSLSAKSAWHDSVGWITSVRRSVKEL
jgi:hypothetical protein